MRDIGRRRREGLMGKVLRIRTHKSYYRPLLLFNKNPLLGPPVPVPSAVRGRVELQSGEFPRARQGWQCKGCQEAVAKLVETAWERASCYLPPYKTTVPSFSPQRALPPFINISTTASQHRSIAAPAPIQASRDYCISVHGHSREAFQTGFSTAHASVLLRPQEARFLRNQHEAVSSSEATKHQTRCVLSQPRHSFGRAIELTIGPYLSSLW